MLTSYFKVLYLEIFLTHLKHLALRGNILYFPWCMLGQPHTPARLKILRQCYVSLLLFVSRAVF